MFTLNTTFIPTLNRYGIRFRYIGGAYDPMTIIVIYKNLDICRVDVNRDSNEPYNYDVYWFKIFNINSFSRFREKYALSDDLVGDIKTAISLIVTKFRMNRGENKMNNKMYSVSGMKVTTVSNLSQDEMTLTVKPLRSRGIGLADCDRIKEAIESIKTHEDSVDALSYCKADVISTCRLIQMFGKTSIKDVIFNSPATIVFWSDGTKTVVKAENEEFDPEKGLAMAIAKKALGNNYDYYDVFKKYVGKYEKKQKKGN